MRTAFVGVDAGHSRSRRRSVTDVGLPLAGTHRPGRMHRFIRKTPANSGLPNGPTESSAPTTALALPCRGGRPCPPAEYAGFMEICGEFVSSQWADVGIGPYSRMRRYIRIRRGFSMILCLLPGGAEPRPYQGFGRIRTAMQILSAGRFYRNCSNAATHKLKDSRMRLHAGVFCNA